MISLVVRVDDEDSGGTEHYAFIRSPVRIGRAELNDLPLVRPFVSNWHGLVQFDDEGAHYVDLGSKNRSFLEGEALKPNTPTPLAPGATIVIGPLKLVFSRRATGEQPAAPHQVSQFALRAASSSALCSPGPPAVQPPPKAPVRSPPPPPPPATPTPTPTPLADVAAESAARSALDAASLDLDLFYASYRGAFEHLFNAIQGALVGLEGPARAKAVQRLGDRYPALRSEPQFAGLSGPAAPAGKPAAAPAKGAPVPAGPEPVAGETLRLVRAFAESYLPQDVPVGSAADVEALLGRAADVLEAFGRSFLELHRGYEEFGKEMGVRAVQAEGALHRARDARQILAYLLDPRAEGRDRELQRAFADFMMHQVALLGGVEEGARALLSRLSPEAVSALAPPSVWPMRAAALWKAYEERFRELADEDAGLSEVLFGREFARAYASMVGRSGADEAPGEEDGEGRQGEPGGKGGARQRR